VKALEWGTSFCWDREEAEAEDKGAGWELGIAGFAATSQPLLLMHEFTQRLNTRGWKLEWADILRDLETLEEVEVRHQGKRYLLRTPLKGVCGKVLQGARVAIPPPVSLLGKEEDCGAKTSPHTL